MSALTLAEVLRGTAPSRLYGTAPADLAFGGVSHDSRLIRPGWLFVALRGERDGHMFIPDAVARGAAGILGDRLPTASDWLDLAQGRPVACIVAEDSLRALQRLARYWRQRHPVEVVGVTGSVGKTSTKEAIAGVLARRFRVLKNEQNYNNEIGLPLTLLALDGSQEKAVLEMGMYVLGEIRDLCAIAEPRIGVVTNVGPVHLERLGTIERIARAKAELVEALPADGLAVLNGDDPRVRAMAERTRARVVYYGLAGGCDVAASDVASRGLAGVRFVLQAQGRAEPVALRLPGKHNVYNALAAAAVGLAVGLSWREVVAGLRDLATGLRLVAVPGRNGSVVIDDTYNASPASVLAALDVLAELPGRRTAVLGDMLELGSYEEEGHREVGRRAAEVLDKLIAVGERARWLADEAAARGLRDISYARTSGEVEYEPQAGEHILVKGSRSLRMEEVVAKLRAGEVRE